MSGGHVEFEARAVRPYAVTGGRVRARTEMPLEALVETLPGAASGRGLPPEKRAILTHAASYVSVAELSALLHLPLGVVRVLVADLADDRYLTVHTSAPVEVSTGVAPSVPLSLLESVLHGIAAL